MSTIESAQERTASQERSTIARVLLYFSIGGLVILAGIVIWAAAADPNENVAEISEKIFNALLPLFGTWVGAIVAFYFSRENFESASRSVREIAKQSAAGRQMRTVTVREAMLPVAKMKVTRLAQGETDDQVNLKARLIDQLKGPISRLPVLEPDGSVKYMIHESELYRFIYESSIAAPAGQDFAIEKATLADFLAFDGMLDIVTKTFAFVGQDGTLADAKAALDKVADGQDVFVTESGQPREPMIGWLANTVFDRYASFE